jgi:hypothetical protein
MGAIFQHGSGIQAELTAGVTIRALPAVVLGLEGHAVATAGLADYAIGPAAGNHVVIAVLRIGKILPLL